MNTLASTYMCRPLQRLRRALAATALAFAPAVAVAAPAIDLAAGAAGELVRDEASSPLLHAGGGGSFEARLATTEAVRTELRGRADVAALSGGFPQAGATSFGGEASVRVLPRVAAVGPVEVRVGPGVGLRGWTMVGETALNERRTWAVATELSAAVGVDVALGPRDRLELGVALPALALVARPPYATTDEALRARSDDPLALAFTGELGTLDAWARPAWSVRWVRDAGPVQLVTTLDASWLRAADPAPLHGVSIGLRAGVRLGGAS